MLTSSRLFNWWCGATGRVGDPSGKSLERPELDADTLEKNIVGIKNIIIKILGDNLSSGSSYVVFNNNDWWKDMTILDFLNKVGRFARVGTMMAKESVKKRLESEQGMSYTEFTYQLLQAYDFLHLFKNEGINVQIGGSDQWGNITVGTDLIRKNLQTEEAAYWLTFPLLLKNDWTKFGKSEDGALKNDGTKRSEEVTRFVHGEEGLKEAIKATEALRPGAETKLDWNLIERIAEDIPSCSLPIDESRVYRLWICRFLQVCLRANLLQGEC